MGVLTRVGEIFKVLEDGLGFRPLLRFLVPALFGDLPDCRGNPRGFEASRFRRSLPFRDHDRDIVVCIVRKRHLPGRNLEGEMI